MATMEEVLAREGKELRPYHRHLTRKQVIAADKLRDKMHGNLDGRYKMWVRKTNDEEELADGVRCVRMFGGLRPCWNC